MGNEERTDDSGNRGGLEDPVPEPTLSPSTQLGVAFGNWIASLIFGLVSPFLLLLLWGGIVDRQLLHDASQGKQTPTSLGLLLAGTLLGQIFTVILSWIIVTELGAQPFLKTLGWSWTERFKLRHALAIVGGMFVLGLAIDKLLPRHDTSMEEFLKHGLWLKILLAVVATVGAPIAEEVTYRGVLYPAIERMAGRWAALLVVTILFWGIHVPQYIESIATMTSVLVLSLILTGVRMYTRQLLPAFVIHTVFNGIQGVALIFTKYGATSANSRNGATAAIIGIAADLGILRN